MGKALIVVESPAKARTIKAYLGKDYEVEASVGHIKDLPKNSLGVDTEDGFLPRYEVVRGKSKVIQGIRKRARAAQHVFLAPDPDREGEAIAWHLAEEIRSANPNISRVLFHEVTKPAILRALENPMPLDQNKFESQQARRILDRLVGYEISPLLWDKVRRGLSAGRVQSVAVRLVVERERAIAAFRPEEFWTLTAELAGPVPPSFTAKLIEKNGKRHRPANEAEALAAEAAVKSASLVAREVQKKRTKRSAAPPFVTSKLQQEAARQLRMNAKRTMSVAQSLYEGIVLGDEGAVGLITYMRTDSPRLSSDAVSAARAHIEERYGPDYLPPKPNVYRTKKRSQDAHEAIRPTSLAHPPERVRPYLGRDEFRLYSLVWNRFIACQMAPAQFDQTTIDVAAGDYTLRARGSVLVFPGYTAVFRDHRAAQDERSEAVEKNGNGDGADNGRDRVLPPVIEGDALALVKLETEQRFTDPPPRYTESGLIRELEDQGIGRPSTYAAIITTIQDKEYTAKGDDGRFRPTELGSIVTDLLVENFPEIMDIKFTAEMESELDHVEEGSRQWLVLLQEFYEPFSRAVQRAKQDMRDVKRQEIKTEIDCDRCGQKMVIKFGRNGSFLGCSAYPECRNTKEYERTDDGAVQPKEPALTGEKCGECGAALAVKQGKFGRFLACSNYPQCKSTKPIGTGVDCPSCKKGELVEKRSRRGKTFWSCSRYPQCDYASWDRPLPEPCPQCDAPSLFERRRRGGAAARYCPACGHEARAMDSN